MARFIVSDTEGWCIIFKKRRRPTPNFKIPPPFNPIQGENANLRQDGVSPFCALMQVAEEDTHEDFVICRGFDPRILKYMNNISVAKPFGKRTTDTYHVGEIYPAFLPTQGNPNFSDWRNVTYFPPSPSDVDWRLGQNPGVVTGGTDGGQPENLSDAIEILYDHNGKVINWLLIDSNGSEGDTLATFTFDSPTHSSSGTFSIAEQLAFTFSDLTTLAGVTPPLPIVVNEFNLIGLAGDTGLAAYRSSTSEWLLIDVYPAKTRRFYFELTGDWPNGLDQTSTSAVLLFPDPTHHGGNTNWATITLRDRFNKASNAKGTGGTKDSGVCQLNYRTAQFDIMQISHVCWRGRASVYSGFTDTPATFNVDGVIGFDGRPPTADPLTVYNDLNIETMNTGDPVEIRWDSINGHYYAMPPAAKSGVRAIQGTLTALTTATTGDYTGKKIGTITVVVAPCSDTTLIGESVDVVDWSGCVFDREFADLEDVWVWASEGIAASLDEEADPGDLTPCHWTANDRCCVAADGGA